MMHLFSLLKFKSLPCYSVLFLQKQIDIEWSNPQNIFMPNPRRQDRSSSFLDRLSYKTRKEKQWYKRSVPIVTREREEFSSRLINPEASRKPSASDVEMGS